MWLFHLRVKKIISVKLGALDEGKEKKRNFTTTATLNIEKKKKKAFFFLICYSQNV